MSTDTDHFDKMIKITREVVIPEVHGIKKVENPPKNLDELPKGKWYHQRPDDTITVDIKK